MGWELLAQWWIVGLDYDRYSLRGAQLARAVVEAQGRMMSWKVVIGEGRLGRVRGEGELESAVRGQIEVVCETGRESRCK